MKNVLYILLFISSVGNSQTKITNANFDAVTGDCLSTNSVTSPCLGCEYDPTPDWDWSNVTDISGVFKVRPYFNADICDWKVSNVTNMVGIFWGAASFNQKNENW